MHIYATDEVELEMKKTAIGVAATFLVGVMAGTALSSGTPEASASSSGQRVCVNRTSGAMRLASVKRCSGSERAIVFGESGAQGPTGPAGPAGPPGPQGAAGVAGSNASLPTKQVTIKYTSSSGLFNTCGSGTGQLLSGASIYAGSSFSSSSLSSSWNWAGVNNCSITLTVIDQ